MKQLSGLRHWASGIRYKGSSSRETRHNARLSMPPLQQRRAKHMTSTHLTFFHQLRICGHWVSHVIVQSIFIMVIDLGGDIEYMICFAGMIRPTSFFKCSLELLLLRPSRTRGRSDNCLCFQDRHGSILCFKYAVFLLEEYGNFGRFQAHCRVEE